MARRSHPFVLFAAAAGPEVGFGHLIRCGVLAAKFGTRREMSLRASEGTTLAAVRFGWTVHRGPAVIDALRPDLVVVDDPSRAHRERWVKQARTAGIPVAAICDGDAGDLDADLVVDGSFAARPDGRPARHAGPGFAILADHVLDRRRHPRKRERERVFLALGGGAHVRRLGASIARELVRVLPGVQVHIAAGFVDAAQPRLPHGCRWVEAPSGLSDHFATATVAVVAGGVSMYEACALGTPVVAVPVVPAQRAAIDAAVAIGAVRAAERTTPPSIVRTVRRLVEDPSLASVHANVSSRVVDGRGADRVAALLRVLVDSSISPGVSHAA